ncbi:MAG: hypothetical protein HY942_04285, partial [Gammaproteobacteria bacterium]|nr:hypothetical protein [Gammaproteobacteria bacterium]
IPKAVGYSAGLIDYFFRGKLEITLPDEAVYGIVDHSQINQKDTQGFTRIKMKLKNATPDIVAGGAKFPQDMTGGKLELVAKFRRNTCYQPDLTGEFSQQSQRTWNGQCGTNDFRSPEEIAVSQPIGSVTLPADPKAAPTLFTFEFDPAKPIPINATDLYLQVVYRGPLGAEADAVAVATNDVYEPTYFTFLNNTDYFPANGKFYKVYNDPYNPQNPYTPELLAQVDRDNNGIPDVPVDPVTSTLMRLRVDASTKDVAVAASLPPARQWRVTYLTDQSPHTIRVLASGVTAAPLQVSAETVQNDALGRLAISPPSRMTRGFIRFNLIYIYRDPYGALPPLDDVDTLGPLKDLTLVPVGVVFNPGP